MHVFLIYLIVRAADIKKIITHQSTYNKQYIVHTDIKSLYQKDKLPSLTLAQCRQHTVPTDHFKCQTVLKIKSERESTSQKAQCDYI